MVYGCGVGVVAAAAVVVVGVVVVVVAVAVAAVVRGHPARCHAVLAQALARLVSGACHKLAEDPHVRRVGEYVFDGHFSQVLPRDLVPVFGHQVGQRAQPACLVTRKEGEGVAHAVCTQCADDMQTCVDDMHAVTLRACKPGSPRERRRSGQAALGGS